MTNTLENSVNKRVIDAYEELRKQGIVKNKTAFAKAGDFLPTYWSGYEQGTRKVSVSVASKLSRHFGISFDWLMHGEGQMLKSDSQPISTIGNLPARPVTLQYTDKFYREGLLKSKIPFESYKQGLPSESALQEFANHFDTTVEELAASLTPRKQKAPVQHEVPAFISQLKEWGSLVIPVEQHAAHIEQAVEEQTNAVKTHKDYACFEILAGSWVACKLLPSSSDAVPDSLCMVVTQTAISATHVRPGKSPGDIMTYNPGSPPDYLLVEDILQVWACEMWLSSQI